MSNYSKPPTVSVCMPMYNAALHLQECLDSILSQTFGDFELLIVDDGSTDESVAIVEACNDTRVRLIKNEHDYIASLNLLLAEAKGKYIARMDADDVMMPYRLEVQHGYMEKHPEVGVLGGGLLRFGKAEGRVQPISNVTMYDMVNACCMAHPTVMMRASVLREHGLGYDEHYKYAEDYHLWVQMLKCGVKLRNIEVPLVKYRISDNQVSNKHTARQQALTEEIKRDAAQWLLNHVREVSDENVDIPQSSNLLTIVIPFLNEGEEVRQTVRSVRNTASRDVDIIVINDCSDDGYDYASDLAPFGVTYVRNACRIGAAASKHKGARLARTPYFLLLDAHMRAYTKNWHNMIVDELKQNDNRLLCCQTQALGKDKKNVVYDKNVALTDGAYLLFDQTDFIPGITWLDYRQHGRLPQNMIASVLGAGYAASKRFWSEIRGLEGLMHYGSEEAYISIKAWLHGDGCALLPDVVFGHIYRKAAPYRIISAPAFYNHFVISHTLFPTSLRCKADAVGYRHNKGIYEQIKFWLSMNKPELEQLKHYYADTFHHKFERVLAVNNAASYDKLTMAEHELKRLPLLLEYVKDKAECLDNVNLWNGCMGYLIALCEYDAYAADDSLSDLGAELLERITSTLKMWREYPISFAHGICGIGWGLAYLLRNDYIEGNFEKEFSIIDSKVMELNLERVTDYTFKTGLGGVYCYVAQRLHLAKISHTEVPFDKAYVQSIMVSAQRALKFATDLRTLTHAELILSSEQADWQILPPRLVDVMDFPTFLPEDKAEWSDNFDGALGYLCHLLKILQTQKPVSNLQPCTSI